jgi:hypothetical protein
VADDAYDVKTPRARRHVVFVDKQYYVLLDEIEPAQPSSVELRFHSYGAITQRAKGGWTVSAAGVGLDIVPAALDGTVEVGTPRQGQGRPEERGPTRGWIRPVNVLRLTSGAERPRFLVATALVPSTAADLAGVAVAQTTDGDEVQVDVGKDRLTWRCGPGGCEFRGVAAR